MDENLLFCSKDEINYTINYSNYFNRMNKYDLIARKMKTTNEYREYYKKNILFFSQKEKKLLLNYIVNYYNVNQALKNYQMQLIN